MNKAQNFSIAALLTVAFLMLPNAVSATEYQGDGTYNLRVGDSIKATNGYTVELHRAWGEMGTRSDWRTDFMIGDPSGKPVGWLIRFGKSGTLFAGAIRIEYVRYVENEALVTVTPLQVFENDGTYNLRVGDSIKATNGYTVRLIFFYGSEESPSANFAIYNPDGGKVGEGYFDRDNGPRTTDMLRIKIEGHTENEALVTVTSLWVFENDGSYSLKIGDWVKATNGCRVRLVSAAGAPNWRTDLLIYSPDGDVVSYTVWDNGMVKTENLTIGVERHAENEAIIAVMSLMTFENDGSYNLKIGDSIRATNGYCIKLVSAAGAPDWTTSLSIYDSTGNLVENIITRDNETVKTLDLTIRVERCAENKALVTVISEPRGVVRISTKPGIEILLMGLISVLTVALILCGEYARSRTGRTKKGA